MTNVIKFQSPFERIKLYNESPETMLCKAILTQAIIDATNNSYNEEAKKHEISAKKWIFGNDEYFQEICYASNLEPSFIIKITRQLIKIQKNKTYNVPKMKNTSKIIPKLKIISKSS